MVMIGGEHSYVERFIESLKDRLRGFDICFPRLSLKKYGSAISWIGAWSAFYNYVRTHLTFGSSLAGLNVSDEIIRLYWLVYEVMHLA